MNQVNLKEIKHPIEKRAFWTLFVFALPIWAAIIISLVMSVVGIFVFLFIVLVGWIIIRLLRAYLLGNSVRVTPDNFPDVYNTTEEIKKQLNYDKPIEVYILYSPILNAFATVFRGTRIVVLLSEVVEAFTEDDIRELKYLLGHEIGHVVAGHFSIWARMVWIFRWIPVIFNWYSRGCEYTADRIGYIVSGDINTTVSAITKFVVGNKLSKKVNLELLRKQAEEVRYTLSGRYGELFSTHPYLVKRIVELETYTKGEESFAVAGAKDLKASLAILIPAILLSGAVIAAIFTAITLQKLK